MTKPASGCLWRRLDLYRDLLPIHCAQPGRYPFLLESVARGSPQARYDVLFAFTQGSLSLNDEGRLAADSAPAEGSDFLKNLDGWWRETCDLGEPDLDLPFYGGWFVYLGYELAGQIEPVPELPFRSRALPIAAAYRVPAAVIRDHLRQETILVAEHDCPELLEVLEEDVRADPEMPANPRRVLLGSIQEEEGDVFLGRVERIQRYIREGDVFQVNLSRLWEGRLRHGVTHGALYQRLREQNPAPFAGLAVLGDAAVICSSPERLVNMRDGVVSTRPIAGTHPRARIRVADRALSRALLAHPKERAEHIMLIDLERNDVGKVSVTGSVQVDELMTLESYAHVHHIVSNVRGRLVENASPGDVIRAVFPGGTITGCPKVRCMQIIAELEGASRGPYTGAMGYINRDGNADLNILIRMIARENDRVSIRAGAGIVADSIPGRELDETRQKARGPLRALSLL